MPRVKPKKKNKKRDNQRYHAINAGLQRLGIVLDIPGIIRKIQNQETTPISKKSLTRTKHLVEHQGMKFYVIYDKTRKMIVTVYKK